MTSARPAAVFLGFADSQDDPGLLGAARRLQGRTCSNHRAASGVLCSEVLAALHSVGARSRDPHWGLYENCFDVKPHASQRRSHSSTGVASRVSARVVPSYKSFTRRKLKTIVSPSGS